MKKAFLIIIAILLLINDISFAQSINCVKNPTKPVIINPFALPVGSGARALGMGGAFIAVADDATAASWNPGGLIQLERPELSLVGSFSSRRKNFDSDNPKISLDNSETNSEDLNYASIVYPFSIRNRDIVVSLNYQQVYDFDEEINFKEHDNINNLEKISSADTKGGISAISPAAAIRILPELSFGVAVNIYTNKNFDDSAWEKTRKTQVVGDTTVKSADQTYKDYQAINATTGLLWRVWTHDEKRITVGATYDTPYTAKVDQGIDFKNVKVCPDTKTHHSFDIEYPMSFGAGIAYRHNDRLTFSTDATWTDWSRYMKKDEDGNESRPIGGAGKNRNIDDTYTVRCGTEYLTYKENMILPLRGGIFYDPRVSLTPVYKLCLKFSSLPA